MIHSKTRAFFTPSIKLKMAYDQWLLVNQLHEELALSRLLQELISKPFVYSSTKHFCWLCETAFYFIFRIRKKVMLSHKKSWIEKRKTSLLKVRECDNAKIFTANETFLKNKNSTEAATEHQSTRSLSVDARYISSTFFQFSAVTNTQLQMP